MLWLGIKTKTLGSEGHFNMSVVGALIKLGEHQGWESTSTGCGRVFLWDGSLQQEKAEGYP